MKACTLYFYDDQDDPEQIACDRLVRHMFDNLPCVVQPPLMALPALPAPAALVPAPRPLADDDDDVDDVDDDMVGVADRGDASVVLLAPHLWEHVGKLQWANRSDRVIDTAWVQRVITRMRTDDEFRPVSHALGSLCWATRQLSPALAAEDLHTTAQIVAQGLDVTRAVIEAPDLIGYFKTEQQPVELAKMMGL